MKQIVLLVGICYLLNPLQNQIITVLHSVAHAIEMPQTLLSHSDKNDKLHNHHNHDSRISAHDHQFIDLVDSVFEASNEDGDSEQSIMAKVKVKKHIASSNIILPVKYTAKSTKKYFSFDPFLCEGYSKKLEFPPNHLLG